MMSKMKHLGNFPIFKDQDEIVALVIFKKQLKEL